MTTLVHRNDEKGFLPKIGHQLVHIYDWISGPPMSEQERIQRQLAESDAWRRIGPTGF